MCNLPIITIDRMLMPSYRCARFMPYKKKFRKRLWERLCEKAGYSVIY